MRPSLRAALVPRSPAQWMALLGLIPFGAGAWMQARTQREVRIALMVTDQRLDELERRLDELTERSGSVGVRLRVSGDTGTVARATVPATPAFDSLDDGTRALRNEAQALSREFGALTATREKLRAQRVALRGLSPANILLALGALLTMSGVLIDIRQFRQLRRRAA